MCDCDLGESGIRLYHLEGEKWKMRKRATGWAVAVSGIACLGLLLVAGCGGDDGAAGLPGPAGTDGTDGDDGITGDTGLGVEITDRHGTEMLLTTGEYESAGKYFADATIISATANASGVATVSFTVKDEAGDPAPGITGMDFGIAALFPASGGESFNKWVSYVYNTATVSGSYDLTPPNAPGTQAEQAYRENGGTFTDYGDGSYSYVFDTDLSTVTTPVSSVDITYDRSFTHRVSVMIGGHSGATADANFDFVPAGGAITETRDIVQTDTCIKCHGVEFHGHGGDRLTMENCVTCHNAAGGSDPEGGALMDMTVMIHKIHAGGELASIPGVDGIVFDDPATPGTDESADNGAYIWWGYRGSDHSWEKTAFPAVIQNCTACHEGAGTDVANWMTVPSRLACGSCHDDVDFTSVADHNPAQANDNNCDGCHSAAGIVASHDWTVKEARDIQEFQIDMTVSTPATGDYFVPGESPVITIVLSEDYDQDLTFDTIVHTTVTQDVTPEGGLPGPGPLPAQDGMFSSCYLFVHGPRAKFNPVLTTVARVEVVSTSDLTFDLSTSSATLELVVDGGQDLLSFDPATPEEDILLVSNINVDVTDGTWVDRGAATPTEIMDWLNTDTDFEARCIAYLEPGGEVAIRSRNLGDFFSLQLKACEVTTVVFNGNTDVQVVGGYYPNNYIYQHALALDDDPKADWTTDMITYTLDPVDDLKPGTYVASVEISDRGRISGSDYTTPSVASVTFQVGQTTEEPLVAANCGACHQSSPGRGYVLDFARHHKQFGNTAVDMCAACHDYQSGKATGAWYGGKPISKRTHAVHRGAYLNYPNTTVDHEDTIAGRNWAIHFPHDIRHCESCHTDTTSG